MKLFNGCEISLFLEPHDNRSKMCAVYSPTCTTPVASKSAGFISRNQRNANKIFIEYVINDRYGENDNISQSYGHVRPIASLHTDYLYSYKKKKTLRE